MEKKRPIPAEVVDAPKSITDVKIGAEQERTRDKIFHVLGKTVEFTADTVNFTARSAGYAVGAAGRATVDGVIAVYRGATKKSFDQAA